MNDGSMNEHQTRVYALALDVWQSADDAEKFMAQPHVLLAGKNPNECASTEAGAQLVEAILQNIRWGLPR